jgi:outer membrane protein assembly factor BamB
MTARNNSRDRRRVVSPAVGAGRPAGIARGVLWFALAAATFGSVIQTGRSTLADELWSNWRGPGQNGVSGDDHGPLRWSESTGIRWKTPLRGAGIASPIVFGDAVVTTTAEGPRQSELHVICYDRYTGVERWDRRLWGTAPTLFHATKSGMASPTPATDGKHLYAFFGTGDLFCLELDGRLRWQRSLAEEYGSFENRFGHTSSPLLDGELIILQCDHYGASYLVAIDKQTGANRWKIDRPGVWHSWSSPQIVAADGRRELLVCSSEAIEAFDVPDGATRWKVRGLQRECIPTAVVGLDRIFAVSGPKGKTFSIRPGGVGDVTDSHVDWVVARGGPFVPSPILVGEQLYLIDDQGIASCLNARNGQRVWQKRLLGEYTVSPVAAGDRIYFINDAGETTVVKAFTRQYEELARNSLGEPVYASPALAGGRLYLRGAKHLFCIE